MKLTDRLINLFRQHPDQMLTMHALEMALSTSPGLIWQAIEHLQRIGYCFDVQPAGGFRLTGTIERLSADLISCGLITKRVGREILVFDETDSTNDITAGYAAEEGYDGLAVFAEHQRVGRGRLGRIWSAPKGSSLLCSVLLIEPDQQAPGWLSLLAGLAVRDALRRCCNCPTRIKWPNDVMVDGKKLAGTMIESRQVNGRRALVVGIGINCLQQQQDFPPRLQDTAISLQIATRRKTDRVWLAQGLLRHLDMWLERVATDGIDLLHDQWLAAGDDVGREVTLIQNGRSFTGRIVDIDCRQGLALQLNTGPVKMFDPETTTVAV